jgi:hypothetical protein
VVYQKLVQNNLKKTGQKNNKKLKTKNMSKEIREQIDRVRNWKPILKEDNNIINMKIAEFYKIYLNLYWLCTYFNNIDKFSNSKQAIFKKNKKFPLDKDLKIDNNLYFNGFTIPLAKSEDDFRSLGVSLFLTLNNNNNNKSDAEQQLTENISNSVYDKKFDGIYSEVYNLDTPINKLFKDLYDSFYKENMNLKNDELLKQTTIESKNYLFELMRFENQQQDANLANLIFRTFYKDKPELLEKIWV